MVNPLIGQDKTMKVEILRVSDMWNIVQHCSTLFNNVITSLITL